MATFKINGKNFATQDGTGAATVHSDVVFPAGIIKNVHIVAGRYSSSDGDQTISADTETRVSNVLSISVTNGFKYFFIFNVPTVHVGGNDNAQTNKSIRFFIRKTATTSPSDGTGIASETLVHSTMATQYVNQSHNGPYHTGAICGIYTATATETNHFCCSFMTGQIDNENGLLKADDYNAMLICQEIFQ